MGTFSRFSINVGGCSVFFFIAFDRLFRGFRSVLIPCSAIPQVQQTVWRFRRWILCVCLFFFSPTQFVCLFFWKTHTAPRSPFRSTSSVRPPRRAIGFYRVVPSLLLLLLLLLLLRSLVSSSVSRLVRFGSHIRPRESRPMIVIIYPTTPGATPRSFQIREEKRRDHREIERNRLRFVCVCFLSA